MKGAPTKPRTVDWFPTSALSWRRASPTKGTLSSGVSGVTASTCCKNKYANSVLLSIKIKYRNTNKIYLHCANRIKDNRSLSSSDIERNVHSSNGRKNVGKQDHAIRLESPPGLKRNFYGDIYVFRTLPKRSVLLAEVLIHL